MTFHDKLRSMTVVIASALAMTLGATATLAQQPAGTPPGPQWHGPGHGEPVDMIGGLMMHAKTQLNLNTSQQQMFDAAVASTKAAMQTGTTLHQSVKDALTAELAKTEPDLAAVAAASDNAKAQGDTLRKQLRAQWLALYATFTPDQKAVVKGLIQQRMAQAEALHTEMVQRRQRRAAGTTN